MPGIKETRYEEKTGFLSLLVNWLFSLVLVRVDGGHCGDRYLQGKIVTRQGFDP